MSEVRREFGIICDRTHAGLGYSLLRIGYTPEQAWDGTENCPIKGSHYHRLKERYVTTTDWEDTFDAEGLKQAQVIR